MNPVFNITEVTPESFNVQMVGIPTINVTVTQGNGGGGGGGATGIKAGQVNASSFSGSPLLYQVTFGTAYPNTNYSIAISAEDARLFTYQNKTASGFKISANSATPLTSEVSWMTMVTGEQ